MSVKKFNFIQFPVILFVSLIALVLLAGCTLGPPAYADDNSPVMYFYSPNCHFCNQLKPILFELADEGFRLKLMNVDTYPDYWDTYSIAGTPTMIAANGDRLVGLQSKERLREWLTENNAKIK